MAALSELPLTAASVWTTIKNGLAFANSNMSSTDLATTKAIAAAMAVSLKNALAVVNQSSMGDGLSRAYDALVPIFSIELEPYLAALPSQYLAMAQARTSAIQAVTLALLSYRPTLSNPATALPVQQPIVGDPLLLELIATGTYESIPLSLSITNFQVSAIEAAQNEANAWEAIGDALQAAGTVCPGVTYDAARLMQWAASLASLDAAEQVQATPSDINTAWNQLAFWPAILRAAGAYSNDPTDRSHQETAVLRYLLVTTRRQFNALLVSLRDTVPSNVRTGTLLQGETLMDLAARELGDYERWRDIVAVNALRPPYISTVKAPNVIVVGQQIFLPTTASVVAPLQVPSYDLNFLGTDLFYGPLNAPMLDWTGDFQSVSGYKNLEVSLGRRLQTTLGTLICHPDFGSRIPPEVGAIADNRTAGYIKAYAISAVLSDPRVESTQNESVSVGDNYAINVQLTAIPYGNTASGAVLNEVLQPAQ